MESLESRRRPLSSIVLQWLVTMSGAEQGGPPPAATNPNPTSWLQNLGIAIEIIGPALALIVTLLRIYIRVSTKAFGWGEF